MSNRKPSHLKLLQGRAGHRKIPVEPAIPSEIPKPPAYLSKAARREWRHAAPLLKAAGLLSMQDREAFGRWCTLVAKIAVNEKLLAAADSPTTTSQSGYLMPHPLVAIINADSKQLVGLSDRFLLNPKARIGAHVAVPKTELNDFEKFLLRGKDRAPC